ncbi:hypothetical protein SAY87_014971 [Trapa incisa]|uniref:Uncharacterized protein n=1 Tax=Trapa incisa TaxID=236973 RepID=A0AAN7GKX5_9MYRT|nr:hypothetical protein SAY87_014971 [Trapa incisa]
MATLGEGDPRGDTWQESADNIPVIIINLAESSGARAEEVAVLNKKVEIVHNVEGLLEANPRLHVVREEGELDHETKLGPDTIAEVGVGYGEGQSIVKVSGMMGPSKVVEPPAKSCC